MRQNSSTQTTELQYTITHQGVPIGVIELPPHADRITVAVVPLPAYDTLQPIVRRASDALADVALGRAANATALQAAAALGRVLELRDASGALVPVDFIELTEWPGGNVQFAAFVALRDSHAIVPAKVQPRPRRDSDSSAPVDAQQLTAGLGNGTSDAP